LPRGAVKGLRSLVSFFTSIPTGALDLDSAARMFFAIPLVALLEGALAFSATAAVRYLSTPLMAAATLLAAHVAITRALHLDALADYADVVGSLRTGEEALRVLKDPRKGAFAIVALGLYVALFIASAESITASVLSLRSLLGTIESVYLWSLETMYIVAALSPPEPYSGLGRKFVEFSKDRRRIALNCVGVALAAALCFWLAGPITLVSAPASIAVALIVSRDCRKRLGFANGDVLGASNEIARIAIMCAIAVSIRWI